MSGRVLDYEVGGDVGDTGTLSESRARLRAWWSMPDCNGRQNFSEGT